MSEIAWTDRYEYGVICDRTEFGHGKALLTTHRTVDAAFDAARRAAQECLFTRDHPHEVKRRIVRMTGWSDAIWAAEHVGGCNDKCTPTTHHLNGATR